MHHIPSHINMFSQNILFCRFTITQYNLALYSIYCFLLLIIAQYPGMDFSIHCDTSNTFNGIQCPDIQNAIKTCHRNRKKVLLGIGGSNALEEFTTFTDGMQAKRFASNVWNLFLGGQTDASIRPFGK